MQENLYLCLVKGEAVEFKLNKTAKTKTEIENYRKSFESSFESSYEAMFHDNTAGGLLDGIYTDPDSTIEVYKGLNVSVAPLFAIKIKEVDTVQGEVIDEPFLGLIERSIGTVGDFLIRLPKNEKIDPAKFSVHVSSLVTSNGIQQFATGYSYSGYEGSEEEFDFEKGVDASLLLDGGYSMNLTIKNQDFFYNFGDNQPKLLSQEQLDKAAENYGEQWQNKEKILFELFKKDVISIESVKRAASYFSIARSFKGNNIGRWQNVIDALNLIQPGDMNPFTKVHEHLVKTMGVKNVPSATSKFIFLRKRNHSLPIYDSVVKKSLGLKANCNYSEFQAAFNLVFIEYQKELKIACNKLDDDIAKQAWFQMRVLDLALWELQK